MVAERWRRPMGRAAGENAEADATRAAAARSALLYIIGCRWSLSFYTYKGTRQNRPNVLGKRCLISFPKSPAVTFKKCDLIVFLATPCFDRELVRAREKKSTWKKSFSCSRTSSCSNLAQTETNSGSRRTHHVLLPCPPLISLASSA